MALERVEHRRSGPQVFLRREQIIRHRPALRIDIPRNRGVDLVTDLEQNGYRYEDAVFKLRTEAGKFKIGPKLSDWMFSPGDVRKDMKGMRGKGNPDEWEFDISDPNEWWLIGIAEYKWQAGDIEKEGREKRIMFKNLFERLEHNRILPGLLKNALPELNVPSSVRIKTPFDQLRLTYISPDKQTAEFFERRNIEHFPIPRIVVDLVA